MNPEVSSGRRRAILALLAITVLIVVMDLTIINVALTPIQQSLNATNAELQWSLDTYLITFAAFLFTGGVCADRFGRKRTLMAGLVLFGASPVLGAYADTITELIVWRGVMDVGAAVVPTVTLAIIMSVFPSMERPKAIAAWASAAGVAFAVGPVLGGLLLEQFWWGSIFLINAPLVIVGLILMGWLVPESKNPAPAKFDPLGVLLSIVAVGLLVYGIVTGGESNDWLAADTLGALVGGVVLLVLLVVIESRMAAPSLDVSLLRSTRFSAGSAAIALCFFALIGAIFITQFYYQAVLGFSPMKAGLLMLPMGVGSMIMSARSPKLMMRFGPRAVVAAGACVMAVSFVLTSQLTADNTYLAADRRTAGLRSRLGLHHGAGHRIPDVRCASGQGRRGAGRFTDYAPGRRCAGRRGHRQHPWCGVPLGDGGLRTCAPGGPSRRGRRVDRRHPARGRSREAR
ncbi:MFS transporter [Streptomyces sp. Act-28]